MMTADLDAVQIATKAMLDRLRESLGLSTIDNLSEREAIRIATATIEAYLRARIVANNAAPEEGEP